jgi:hypothetical protein
MLAENEPCPNYPDNYNNGCSQNGSVHVLPIQCNQQICGTGSSNGQYADFDVYEITLTSYDSIAWCVFANYPVTAYITQPLGNCPSVINYGSASGNPCDTVCVGACLPPGRYWLTVMSFGAVNCLLDQYVAEARCTPCIPCTMCPPNAFIENEPCMNIPDNFNGGCTWGDGSAIPVQCGMQICGTVNNFDFADNDFYSITTQQTDSIIWCVTADVAVKIGIYTPALSCPAMVVHAEDSTNQTCQQLCVSACLPPGTYWLRVVPTAQTGFTCKRYLAEVNCLPCSLVVVPCPYTSRDFEPSNNACTGQQGDFGCNDTLCGEITAGAGAPDRDWYNIFIPGPSCRRIAINVYGNDTPGWYPYGAGLDPRASLWASDCTTLLNFDDSSGVGDDALLISPCLPPGLYHLMVQGVSGTRGPYILTMRCSDCTCPCTVSCGHLPLDGEACPNLTAPDTYNGGCSSGLTPPAFGTMLCNQSFCATSFAMGGIRDYDWYVLTLTAPRRIIWTVQAEFPFQMSIYYPNPDCSNLITMRSLTGNPCQTKATSIICLPVGTYYFYVAPTVTTGVPCSVYRSRLQCGKCFVWHVIISPVDPASANLQLSWDPDETLPTYNVYRLPDYDSELLPQFRIGSTQDTTFIDQDVLGTPQDRFFYQVTMEDPPDSSGGLPQP